MKIKCVKRLLAMCRGQKSQWELKTGDAHCKFFYNKKNSMLPFKENAPLHYSDSKTLHPPMYSCIYISLCLSIFWETILHGSLTFLHVLHMWLFFFPNFTFKIVYISNRIKRWSLLHKQWECLYKASKENFSIRSSRQACLLSVIKIQVP